MFIILPTCIKNTSLQLLQRSQPLLNRRLTAQVKDGENERRREGMDAVLDKLADTGSIHGSSNLH